MPRILVLAECDDDRRGAVVLEERVVPVHLDSDRSSARLIERIGWAILDAEQLERRTSPIGR
jgi:hypothetical protein